MPAVVAGVAAVVTAVSAAAATAVGATVGLIGGSALGLAAASATFAAVPGLLFTTGLSLAAGLLQPHVGQTATGTQVDWQADPSAGVPYLIGRTGTPGNIVFVDTSGDKHKYLTYVTVVSGAGGMTFESFSANGVGVTFGTDSGQGASGYYQNRMWFTPRGGGRPATTLGWTATGSKDTPADHGGFPSTLGTNPKLSGLAHYLWTLEYDANIYTAGVPKPLTVWQGVRCYDPRKDSTYPGGSGAHRWADPSNTAAFDAAAATWEYTENPHLHALRWCLGTWERDVGNSAATYRRTLGVGAPIAAIDVAAFVQGANVNDANAMKVGGVVYSTDAKWDVLTAMLQAGASRPLKLGAKISCLPQMPRVTLDTLRGGDLVDTATVQGTQASRDRINTIWPRYREETQGWEIVPTGGVVGVGEYAALDGAIRTKEVTYSLVQQAVQAAQLARYDIEDARELGPITLPCKPYWMGYKPGDCIVVDEPEIGLVATPCLILNRQQDPATMAVTLTLRTETAAKHAYALGQTQTPPPQPALSGVDPVQVSAPPSADWGCIGGASTSASGQSLPAIVVTGKVTDPNVAEVIVEYRLASGTTWADWTAIKAADPAGTTITGLAPQTSYLVRLRYRSVRGQVGPDASTLQLGPVTTGGVATDWASVANPVGTKPENNATVGATAGVNLKGDGGTTLTEGQIVTSEGTAANVSNVGARTLAEVEAALDAAAGAGDAISAVQVKLDVRPNLIDNPGFTRGAESWTFSNGAFAGGVSGDPNGPYVVIGTPPDNTTSYYRLAEQIVTGIAVGGAHSLQSRLYSDCIGVPTTFVRCVVVWENASNGSLGEYELQTNVRAGWASFKADGQTDSRLTAPAGTHHARVVVDLASSSGNLRTTGSAVAATRIKLELSPVCTPYADDKLGAKVYERSTVLEGLRGTVAAQYTLNVVAGGKVAGFKITAVDGTVSSSDFAISADHFSVVGSDGSTLSFAAAGGGYLTVANLTVLNANIGNLQVGMSKIAANSVTRTASARNDTATTVSSSLTFLCRCYITTYGGSVEIQGQIIGKVTNGASDGSDQTYDYYVYRDDGQIFTVPITVQGGQNRPVSGLSGGPYTVYTLGQDSGVICAVTTLDTPGAGSHYYDLYAKVNGCSLRSDHAIINLKALEK